MSIEANLKKIVTTDTTSKLNQRHHTIFKLEGVNIKKILKKINLNKPFDDNYINTMIDTAIDCFNTFTFSLCYVSCDEIIYYLKPITKDEEDNGFEYDYSGRIQKMVSMLAGKASISFLNNLNKHFTLNNDSLYNPFFECKVWQVNSFHEVIEYINTQILYTLKNSKNLFINYYLPDNELSLKDANKKILIDKQIDFNKDINDNNKIGCIIIYNLFEFSKQIEINGEIKEIKFIKKIPHCTNIQPSNIINIKYEKLL